MFFVGITVGMLAGIGVIYILGRNFDGVSYSVGVFACMLGMAADKLVRL